jgi:cytochrome c-type biogenesis protein CcmF
MRVIRHSPSNFHKPCFCMDISTISIGHFALVSSFIFSVYAALTGTYGAVKGCARSVLSAGTAVVLMGAFSVLSLLSLIISFLRHDYSNLYVWQHSSNDMHPFYLVGAVWGGMDGSMLLWAAIMSVYAMVVVIRKQSVPDKLFSWVIPVLGAACSFFLLVVTFLTNPFRLIPQGIIHADGNGLNPLLQNPSMMIHPPMLYLGFTGFVVPFAFCLAALLSGELTTSWIRLTRRWTLVSWVFLTAGIILGGHWAYIELGWGGFWAWDPVENASFLPWLSGTAFLHSVMVQEHRGMLKVWNIMLAVITYLLTIFGTFLTRSGIVQSVHAFAETDVGWVFLAYLGGMLLFALVLIVYRWRELAPEHVLESYFSREAAFLFNNLCLLAILVTTLWGVMLPVITEAFTGEQSVVGPPFFNKVTAPLFIILLFLMAVGPLISWRKNSFSQLRKTFLIPLVLSLLLLVLGLILDPARPLAALSFSVSFLVIITILFDFHRAARMRTAVNNKPLPRELLSLLKRKPRKYGAHIIHLGAACAAISITAATVYKIERDIDMPKGGKYEVGSYSLYYKGLREEKGYGYKALVSEVEVRNRYTDKFISVLRPEKRIYNKSGEVTTEVDIRSTLKEDLYLAFAGLETREGHASDPGGPINYETAHAVFKVFINPLQIWLWFSSFLMLAGSLVVLAENLWSTAAEKSGKKQPLASATPSQA